MRISIISYMYTPDMSSLMLVATNNIGGSMRVLQEHLLTSHFLTIEELCNSRDPVWYMAERAKKNLDQWLMAG